PPRGGRAAAHRAGWRGAVAAWRRAVAVLSTTGAAVPRRDTGRVATHRADERPDQLPAPPRHQRCPAGLVPRYGGGARRQRTATLGRARAAIRGARALQQRTLSGGPGPDANRAVRRRRSPLHLGVG